METVEDKGIVRKVGTSGSKEHLWRKLAKERYLYLMSAPAVVWLVVFAYLPLWGWLMAFQEYLPVKGIFDQKWIGLDQFRTMFADAQFFRVLRNTVVMNVMSLAVNIVLAVGFALFVNEIRGALFKRSIQTISYLPHFVSWVIVASMFYKLLSTDGGIVNDALTAVGLLKEPHQFMAMPGFFWWIATFVEAWKETGWNSIIYLAAIAGINPELYEAAVMDGAGRFKRMWHITLPCIRPTIMVMLVMCVGFVVSNGFEKQFLLQNTLVLDNSEVLSLYILSNGIQTGRFSYGTAVGIFQSVVSVILLFGTNRISKYFGEGRIL